MIRSRVVAVPLAALALGGVGMAAFGAVGDDSVHYRTVSAAVGDVEQTLSLTGVLEPSGRSDLSFGASGTVSKVRVDQGDEVQKGDVIAVLDRASLRAEVDQATAALADARAQLVDDRAAQSSVVASASTSASASSSSASTSTRGSGSGTGSGGAGAGGGSGAAGGSTAAVLAQLSEQQDAVLTAQTAATTALEAASTALATQQAACADPAATAADAGAVEGTEDTGTEDTGTETPAVLSEDCTAALTEVQTAQVAAAEAQAALQAALETLAGTLGKALATLSSSSSNTGGTATPPSGGTSSGSATSSTSATPSASAASGSAGSSMTRTVTAATLASDQADIDSAKAALLAAKAALAGAVLRAPADVTVVSLPVEQGSAVSAGDTVAIVVAPGLTTVSVDVSRTQAEQLEVGLAVAVTPAGADDALSGSVSRINHTATDATSGSNPTYAVEIVLDDLDLALPDGMPASVSIVVGSAADVVTVPASAVANDTVTVLDGNDTAVVRVTTGIVGSTRIEITDGIDAGDQVVLADLDAELATDDSAQTGRGGFDGGFSGGGFSGGPPSGGMMPR